MVLKVKLGRRLYVHYIKEDEKDPGEEYTAVYLWEDDKATGDNNKRPLGISLVMVLCSVISPQHIPARIQRQI